MTPPFISSACAGPASHSFEEAQAGHSTFHRRSPPRNPRGRDQAILRLVDFLPIDSSSTRPATCPATTVRRRPRSRTGCGIRCTPCRYSSVGRTSGPGSRVRPDRWQDCWGRTRRRTDSGVAGGVGSGPERPTCPNTCVFVSDFNLQRSRGRLEGPPPERTDRTPRPRRGRTGSEPPDEEDVASTRFEAR